MKAEVRFNMFNSEKEIFDLIIKGDGVVIEEQYFANLSPERVRQDAVSLISAGIEMLEAFDVEWAERITDALNSID